MMTPYNFTLQMLRLLTMDC